MLITKILSYGLVGSFGFLFYLLLFSTMVEFVGMDPTPSAAVAFLPMVLLNYFLNHRLVFCSLRPHTMVLPRYLAVAGIGYAMNIGTVYLCCEKLGWYYGYSQILVVLLVPLSNFLLFNLWAFGRAGAASSNRPTPF